jgi:hypothetical protein
MGTLRTRRGIAPAVKGEEAEGAWNRPPVPIFSGTDAARGVASLRCSLPPASRPHATRSDFVNAIFEGGMR